MNNNETNVAIDNKNSIIVDENAQEFYRKAALSLLEDHIDFLIGGAYAFQVYTGIVRHTKDFDIFVRPEDLKRTLKTLERAGYRTEIFDANWIAKAWSGPFFVDIIYGSRNTLCNVDDEWFIHAQDAIVLELPAKICPIEEIIWSKAFVLERERYDGADIAHLIQLLGEKIRWGRLIDRFGPNWEVLLSHLVLFQFIYPSRHSQVPGWVMDELLQRFNKKLRNSNEENPLDICKGTLLSGTQYKVDVEDWGFSDVMSFPDGQ